jgi:hypothetical protein
MEGHGISQDSRLVKQFHLSSRSKMSALTHSKNRFDSFNKFVSELLRPSSYYNGEFVIESFFLNLQIDYAVRFVHSDCSLKQQSLLIKLYLGRFQMKTPCFLLRRGDINRWRLNVMDKFEYEESQCSITCGPSNEILSPRRGPLNRGCGTHINIRFSAEYSLHIPQLKNIAREIIYFEPAFEDLLPKYRRGYAYAKSNGSRIRKASGNGHMAIENAETEYAIVKLMQGLRQTGSENERNPDSDKHLSDPDYACNFNRLSDLEIEFRNAPACASGEGTVRWAELILSFHIAAWKTPDSELEQYSRGIEGLWEFLDRYFVPRQNDPGCMAVLWEEALRRKEGARQILIGRRERG